MDSPTVSWDEVTPTSLTNDSASERSSEDGEGGAFFGCVKSLFDVFDADGKGYVTMSELEKHLSCEDDSDESNYHKFKSPKLWGVLQKICPPNGLISFKRFSLAIQIALGKNQIERTGSLSRSLRPRSFLFAVTESNEDESIKKNRNGNALDRRLSSDFTRPCDKGGKYPDTKDLNDETSEEIFMIQRCIVETSKVKEIYSNRLAQLEKLKSRLQDVGMGIEEISSHLQQLQSKKSSLVKDLFGIRARLLNEPLEEEIPF